MITWQIKTKIGQMKKKIEIGRKISAKLKGKKKPDGFGERLSKATKGKPKLWARGDGNPSKRADVKEKISKAWENRETGKWFYHPLTMGNYMLRNPSMTTMNFLAKGSLGESLQPGNGTVMVR